MLCRHYHHRGAALGISSATVKCAAADVHHRYLPFLALAIRKVRVALDTQAVVIRNFQASRVTESSVTISSDGNGFREDSRNDATGSSARRVVFLGTPECAALSLRILLEASASSPAALDIMKDVNDAAATADVTVRPKAKVDFEIIAVVSQPPSKGKKGEEIHSAVCNELTKSGLKIPVFTPESAKQEAFLLTLEALKPDLCITAAYGNFLPKRFLKLPRFGTINIHPSMLPRYRGSAPMQRCLENGDTSTGISLLYTVLKMDAGPIIYQNERHLKGHEKSPDLLMELFEEGSRQLVAKLPSIFDGSVAKTHQDESLATAAPKIASEESKIKFSEMTAAAIHNKVRAFAGWPGSWARFSYKANDANGESSDFLEVKIITTAVASSSSNRLKTSQVTLKKGVNYSLEVVCSDGSVLSITELQPKHKKIMSVKAFVNGFRGQFSSLQYRDI